ncbi:MAG: hypothetical protein J6Y60_07570 [Treponema sp.]|nr:hypothetical protein [Treponema sp.]
MLNPKKSIFPAVFGFVLSFFISIIATHKLWRSLLRGVIFAVVFAALFIAIDFIFDKFLDKEEGSVSSKRSDSKSGGKIDITISDEDLTDDGEDLRFPVTMNKMGLSQEEMQSYKVQTESAPAPSSTAASPSIDAAPIGTDEVIGSVSASPVESDVFKQTSLASSAPAVEKATVSPVTDNTTVGLDARDGEEIDDLPEIADFDAELGDEDADSIVDDSDFASNGSTSMFTERSTFSDGSRASDHDAATIAKAIQTALKREE